jgi:enolase-phosphatase E1
MSHVQAVLTDIEGTISSISFVKDVLFPYARRALPEFVRSHREQPQVRQWLDRVAAELGADSDDEAVITTLLRWIDEDRKHTALKALQGLIWQDGYRNADFSAHIYPDAAQQLQHWHAAGIPIHVYSSGSVPAQQLFFAHSDAGDLSALVSGWYDTETGGKRDAASYQRIAELIGHPPAQIVFLSDVIAELDAAASAGLQTVLLDRLQDYPTPRTAQQAGAHLQVQSFAQIALPA